MGCVSCVSVCRGGRQAGGGLSVSVTAWLINLSTAPPVWLPIPTATRTGNQRVGLSTLNLIQYTVLQWLIKMCCGHVNFLFTSSFTAVASGYEYLWMIFSVCSSFEWKVEKNKPNAHQPLSFAYNMYAWALSVSPSFCLPVVNQCHHTWDHTSDLWCLLVSLTAVTWCAGINASLPIIVLIVVPACDFFHVLSCCLVLFLYVFVLTIYLWTWKVNFLLLKSPECWIQILSVSWFC